MRSTVHLCATLVLLLTSGSMGQSDGDKFFTISLEACVWHDVEPSTPYNISWTTDTLRSTTCEYPKLSPASMMVERAGLTCVEVGKLDIFLIRWFDSPPFKYPLPCSQAKSWNSTHVISYTSGGGGGPYSGATTLMFDWSSDGPVADMRLLDPSPGTSICPTEAHCTGSNVSWSARARTVYVVFWPGKVASSAEVEGSPVGDDAVLEARPRQLSLKRPASSVSNGRDGNARDKLMFGND